MTKPSLIEEIERLSRNTAEMTHLPRQQRVDILIEKMAGILDRAGRLPPEEKARIEAYLAKVKKETR